MKAATTFTGMLVLLVATCSRSPATAKPEASVVVTRAATVSELAESSLPDLCDLDGGRWCEPCGATVPCPAGKSGALCCSGGVCVEWTTGACSGVLGWCANYTTETVHGIEAATCHDDE